ncbi:hypothetical protein HY311_02335 [Candidatus Nomurabacteria bacterium]|nr:hypothetical protein [Candidatus Nomurabacteria bacterium]
MYSKKNIAIAVVVVLVVALLGLLKYRAMHPGAYSVVYMTTGEVYVGKLSTFPDLQMTDGYILQVTKDPANAAQNGFQLNPINQALWAPQVMHINRQSVVFYGPLLPTSKIAQTLAVKQ